MRDIGKNIKSIRTSRAMTQDALAEALFVTRQTVSHYETGRSRPDIDMLVKIAEVLGTDVNTVIYGTPIPEKKKQALRHLMIASLVLLISGAAYLIMNNIFTGQYYWRYVVPRIINDQVLRPVVMFLLGWTLFQGIGVSSGLKPYDTPWSKYAKYVLWSILCILIAAPAPYYVWLTIYLIRRCLTSGVAMQFPYIPVYQELTFGIMDMAKNAPFVYCLLGAMFWLFRFPRSRKESAPT